MNAKWVACPTYVLPTIQNSGLSSVVSLATYVSSAQAEVANFMDEPRCLVVVRLSGALCLRLQKRIGQRIATLPTAQPLFGPYLGISTVSMA